MPSTVIDPFSHDVAAEVVGQRDPHDLPVLARRALEDGAGAVDVPLHEVAAEPSLQRDRALEVDRRSLDERAERRAVERLLHDVGDELAVAVLHHGEAHAVDRDRGAVHCVARDERAADPQPHRVVLRLDRHDAAELLHDAGEHSGLLCPQHAGVDAYVVAHERDVGH
jgi:hypothetical protein